MSAEELELGFIVGAHGVGGAVRVRLHDPDSDTLQRVESIRLLRDGDRGEPLDRRYAVSRAAPQPGKPVTRLWLDGVSSREGADALRGCTVWVAKEAMPPLEEDEYYLADLVGVAVLQGEVRLGTVAGVTTNGMQDLLEISFEDRGRSRRWLLPALPEFVLAIGDEPEPHIEVDVPEGMLPAVLERALGRGPQPQSNAKPGADDA